MWPYGHPQHPPMPQLPNYPSFPTSQMHSACPSVMSGTYSSFNPLHPVSVQHLGGMTPPTTSPHSFNSSQCAGFQHACRSIASILWMRSLSAISGTALQPSPCDHPPSSSAGAHFPFGVLLLHRLLFPASATTYACSPSPTAPLLLLQRLTKPLQLNLPWKAYLLTFLYSTDSSQPSLEEKLFQRLQDIVDASISQPCLKLLNLTSSHRLVVNSQLRPQLFLTSPSDKEP